MAISQESFNQGLYDLLRSRGYEPTPIDSKGQASPVASEADVFKFVFDGEPVWATVDDAANLIIYYDDSVMDKKHNDEGPDENFSDFLQILKKWGMRKQLGFELKNRNHLQADMAQREHTKKKESLGESYHAVNRKTSYNDNVPTVKVLIQHNKQLEEGDKRYHNIEKIFVENTNGERFLLPTRRPGIAKVYARHVAEGGTPYDERGVHITSLVEEYTKMAGFVRAVRTGQFNESAKALINEGISHYENLRETLRNMISHRGYSNYFESYTPVLNEETGEENLNELFVKETIDPRIESVMPILSRLHKKLGTVKEADELADWANKIVDEATDLKSIPEGDVIPINPKNKITYDPETLVAAFTNSNLYDKDSMSGDYPDAETNFLGAALQFLRDYNYPVNVRAKVARSMLDYVDPNHAWSGKIDEASLAPHRKSSWQSLLALFSLATQRNLDYMDVMKRLQRDYHRSYRDFDNMALKHGFNGLEDLYQQMKDGTATKTFMDVHEEDVAENYKFKGSFPFDVDHMPGAVKKLSDIYCKRCNGHGVIYKDDNGKVYTDNQPGTKKYKCDACKGCGITENEVEEGLDANQKRVGQLGPTEKITKSNPLRGKLVGASESVDPEINRIKKLSGV